MVDKDTVYRLSAASGIDEQRLDSLLRYLHAPGSLTRLRLVLSNLRKAVRVGSTFHESIFDGFDTFSFPMEDIGDLLDELDGATASRLSPEPQWVDESAEQRGIISDHPEWAALIISASNQIQQNSLYFIHLYIVLHCAILQRQRHKILGAEIDVSCLVLRKIATGITPASALFAVRRDWRISDYLAALDNLSEDQAEVWRGVRSLVHKVVENLGKTRFVSGRSVSGSVVMSVGRADSDDVSPEGPVSEIHVYQSQGDEEERSRARGSGLHPGELEGLRAVGVSYSTNNSTANFNLRDHARRQSSQIQHLSSLNQRLPYRYQQLTCIEISVAAGLPVKILSKWNAERERGTRGEIPGEVLDPYVATLIQLLLWLGRPLHETLSMRFYNRFEDVPKSLKDLAYVRQKDIFILPIRSPEWKRKLSENDRYILDCIGGSAEMTTDHRIEVSCPVRFSRMIRSIEGAYGEVGHGRSNYLFPKDLRSNIESRLREILSHSTRTTGYRLTPLRISQVLFDEISQISSDWVDASLLTGHTFTITEVASHYYSVSGDALQNLYHSAVRSLQCRLAPYLGINRDHFYDFEQEMSNPEEHGSKLNVKPKLVHELVRHFKHELAMAKRRGSGVEACHNALVTYIAFWILFITGYRAVNDLIFDIQEIDWKTGMVVISDKDDDYQSNSRLVWLPNKLLKQIDIYLKHLDAMQAMLPCGSRAWSHIYKLRDKTSSDAPLLFFLKDECSVQRLTPENLREQIPGYSLPINLGRHYLRPRLRALQCNAEYVNAYLGHWQIGQEPFGRYSSMSPIEMFTVMAPYLETLLREGGWTPQTGFANA